MNRIALALTLLFSQAIAEPLEPAVRAKMMEQFEAAAKVDASTVEQLSRRGDALLFLGKFKESVADFEAMIAQDPKQDAPHWRLGIAYYFAGDFAKSAKQFEKYHAYDDRDRENGVWKFFAQARVDGIAKAQKEMLEYTRFDREPFPGIYDMLAGKITGADVLADMKKKNLADDALVMFFAHYYIGWFEQLNGKADAAKEHLGKAVVLAQKAGAGGGPGYMGQVARIHYEALATPAAK